MQNANVRESVPLDLRMAVLKKTHNGTVDVGLPKDQMPLLPCSTQAGYSWREDVPPRPYPTKAGPDLDLDSLFSSNPVLESAMYAGVDGFTVDFEFFLF